MDHVALDYSDHASPYLLVGIFFADPSGAVAGRCGVALMTTGASGGKGCE